mgnify:FL=1
MKNPIEPSFKTERFSLSLIVLSLIAAFYFYPSFASGLAVHFDVDGNADRLMSGWLVSGLWPMIIILNYLMFLLFPYLKINRQESLALKEEWHKSKDLALSFLFITQIISSLILSGQDGILFWALPTLFILMIVVFCPTVSKVIKIRQETQA